MSVCSSSRSTAIILSIAAMTASKWPPALTPAARRASERLPYRVARALSWAYALAPGEAAVWSRDGAWGALAAAENVAWASGLESTATAWAMPWSSSVRMRVREAQWLAFSWQEAFVVAKKASSASSCALVPSSSWPLSAAFLTFCALSRFCFSSVASRVWSSACLVAMRASKAFCCSASSALSFSRSPAKESYMALRMPWIWVDCGA
mmetsp:Transcript_89019/g.252293  ORF Transcript_89019/g.252293 Transcript_89019/m.252293 type:complete len:208 (-) Transcript_89019:7-630(-)